MKRNCFAAKKGTGRDKQTENGKGKDKSDGRRGTHQ
jgi:hypothetical protein